MNTAQARAQARAWYGARAYVLDAKTGFKTLWYLHRARAAELVDPEPDMLPETMVELRKMGMR